MWWKRREASSINFTSCAWCGRAGGAAGPAASTAAEPSILIGWCDVWEHLWWCRACSAPPRRHAGVPWCRCRKRRHLMEGEQDESSLTETSAEELHPIWRKLLPDLRWIHETDSHVQAQGYLKMQCCTQICINLSIPYKIYKILGQTKPSVLSHVVKGTIIRHIDGTGPFKNTLFPNVPN